MACAARTPWRDIPPRSAAPGGNGSGSSARYTILGAWDSDPANNVIASKTPLGLALLTRKAGDTVKVKSGNAEESYTITSIARYVDRA